MGAILSAYIDQYVIPKATGMQKVGAIIAGAALSKEAPNIAMRYYDVMEMLGFACNHMIDVDKAHEYAKLAFDKVGKVQFAGLILDSSDVDAIAEIAERYAK